MRILIGNHIDDSLLVQKDQRAFTQRILWFARDHDLVILSCVPDAAFLGHVASLSGLNLNTLKIHVTPPGRFERRLFDPDSLADRHFIGEVAASVRGHEVTEIFALWPSAQVAEFAAELGLTSALPGANFFAQQGDELANNKGNFRAFAAASGVPIADGAVCRTRRHAAQVMRRLLESGAVMVKQAHNGAGLGNQLVWVGQEPDKAQAGGAQPYELRGGQDAVDIYLEERWAWASVSERFPVVVERFVPRARSIYAEFYADEAGVSHTEAGSLEFSDGKLVAETVPLRGVSQSLRKQLVSMGRRLAETYQSFGYRGYLSADALLDAAGNLTFTEMNARIGGSLHLYQAIGHGVVGISHQPERTVVQYVTAKHWTVQGVDHFLQVVRDLGVAYDARFRKGVIAAMPLAGVPGAGGLLFCVVYADEGEDREVFRRLGERLS